MSYFIKLKIVLNTISIFFFFKFRLLFHHCFYGLFIKFCLQNVFMRYSVVFDNSKSYSLLITSSYDQVVTTSITLLEGQASNIEIATSVPPSLLCGQVSPAILQASILVGAFDGPSTCDSGVDLRQVVVGRGGSASPNNNNSSSLAAARGSIPGDVLSDFIAQNQSNCQQTLDDLTWRGGLSIPVWGTLDLVRDGDRSGSIDVTVSVNCLTEKEDLVDSSVEVSSKGFNFGKLKGIINIQCGDHAGKETGPDNTVNSTYTKSGCTKFGLHQKEMEMNLFFLPIFKSPK